MNFLPQCDAALFVISADPPITEVELAFLREIKAVSPVLLVLNKVDYLTDAERETALAFYRDVLTRRPVSILQFLSFPGIGTPWIASPGRPAAKNSGPRAGLSEVSDHLIRFLARDKNLIIRDAIGRKALNVFRDVRFQLGLEIPGARTAPSSLESRLADLTGRLRSLRSGSTPQDILPGEQPERSGSWKSTSKIPGAAP